MTEYAYDTKSGLWYRPEVNDQYVIQQEVGGYVRRLQVVPGARVLDIGAHIGAATARFVSAGADLVVAVEPDPDNYALLVRNLPVGMIGLHAAVVGDESPTVTLWQNTGRGRNSHSLYARRGRTHVDVPAVNIARLVADHDITHVKMDCEGSEYDLLAVPLGGSVRHLLVEFHANDDQWRKRLPGSIAQLMASGFAPDRVPESTAWNWVVGWHR